MMAEIAHWRAVNDRLRSEVESLLTENHSLAAELDGLRGEHDVS